VIFFEIMQLPASRGEGIAKRNICIFVGLMIYDEFNAEHGGVEPHFVFDPMVLMFVRQIKRHVTALQFRKEMFQLLNLFVGLGFKRGRTFEIGKFYFCHALHGSTSFFDNRICSGKNALPRENADDADQFI